MKNTQKGGQKSHLEAFSDPWLAQASLWLAWATRRLRGEVTVEARLHGECDSKVL